MLCEHCGTDNLDEAINCAMCGVGLGDPSARLHAARQRRKRRYDTAGPRISAWTGGRMSVALGAVGAYCALSSLDMHTRPAIIVFIALCGLAGLILGLNAVKNSNRTDGVNWARGVALAGTIVSTAVLAGPVVAIVTVTAMLPRQLAMEPVALNNMRSLSQALFAYAEDNNDTLPGWTRDDGMPPRHNVWDQQIAPYLRGDGIFLDGTDGRGIRSTAQPAPRRRVVCFGLNGLLITHAKPEVDGNANWAGGPAPSSVTTLTAPASTIVLAELATNEAMGGPYMLPDSPGTPAGDDTRAWRNALPQWIDIDPRAWVETSGPVKSYERRNWNPDKGVGRSLHAGGACYAFADGHVGFEKLRKTVTGGQVGMPTDQHWSPANTGNLWNPR